MTTHTIYLEGQEIYRGEDWGKAQQLFIDCVQALDTTSIRHEVKKRVVPCGNPPEKTNWGDPLRQHALD